MNYVVRITGPGVDHQVMVNSAEDQEALELIIAKIRKHLHDSPPTGVISIPPQPSPPIVNETQYGGRPCHALAIHDAFPPIGVPKPAITPSGIVE